jgi:hypothetical protein
VVRKLRERLAKVVPHDSEALLSVESARGLVECPDGHLERTNPALTRPGFDFDQQCASHAGTAMLGHDDEFVNQRKPAREQDAAVGGLNVDDASKAGGGSPDGNVATKMPIFGSASMLSIRAASRTMVGGKRSGC